MPPTFSQPLPCYLFAAWRALQVATTPRARRRALRRRLADGQARPAFWLRLAHALFPSASALPPWFALPPARQWRTALAAWAHLPQHPRRQRLRQRLLSSAALLARPDALPKSWRNALQGLYELGLWHPRQGLTPLGEAVLLHAAPLPNPSPRPWRWQGTQLKVPCPTEWTAWASLEGWLAPRRPGIYPLDLPTLAALREQGHGPALLDLLASMGASPPPFSLGEALTQAPEVTYRAGMVFFFTHETDFQTWLAQNASEAIPLGPGKVLVPLDQAAAFRRQLEDQGIRVAPNRGEAVPALSPASVAPDLPPSSLLLLLRQTINRGADLVMTYQDAQGRITRRRITPLTLEEGAEGWLLWAFCHEARALRRFYVHRILEGHPPSVTPDKTLARRLPARAP